MSCLKGNDCNSIICRRFRLWHSSTTSPQCDLPSLLQSAQTQCWHLCDTFAVVLQPKRPFMLRTLPSRQFAELEELLPQALSNSTMVNGLECKLSNKGSKVSCLISEVVCRLSGGTTLNPDMCAFIHRLLMLLIGWHGDLTNCCLMQVSYVIETSDTFLRRNRRRHDMSTLVQRRADKFHDWYHPHELSMIPAYAAVLGI